MNFTEVEYDFGVALWQDGFILELGEAMRLKNGADANFMSGLRRYVKIYLHGIEKYEITTRMRMRQARVPRDPQSLTPNP